MKKVTRTVLCLSCLAGPALAEPTAAEPAAAEPAAGPVAQGFKLSMFADAYAAYQSAKLGSPSPVHRAFAANSPAYTAENGFSLSFVGLDAVYDQAEFGATASLRFGPSTTLFHTNNPALGIDNLVQGYVTWRPATGLTLDLGQFGTIFGAEVAESWKNLNYSRGGLYYLMQPFWHTGLRARYDFSDAFNARLMVVNGVNNITENDEKPSVALQVEVKPGGQSILAGCLLAGDGETDPSGFDMFCDVVATVTAGRFTAIANFDFNVNKAAALPDGSTDDASFFGASLALGYGITDQFGVAARYELLNDSDNTLYKAAGADKVSVNTITGTLDFKPVKGNANLVLRWDNRFESASEDIFFDGDAAATASWFSSILGLVVHADVIGG
jgi:hypothetical protein